MLNLMNSVPRAKQIRLVVSVLLAVLIISGCGNLRNQPKLNQPYDPSPLFDTAARELDPNAVPVGFLYVDDTHMYYGTVNGEYAEGFPMPITEEVLREGQRHFDGFCSPCHGYDGGGEGIIWAEGFGRVASYHIDRLRDAPEGYFFDVITNGQGTMYSYGSRLEPETRWAVIAYIRALQESQDASFADQPEQSSDGE